MTCIMRALSMRHTLKMIVLTLIVSVLSSYGALTITSGDVIRVEIPQEHEQSTTYTVTSDETITFLFGTPLYLGGTPVTKLSAMVKKHLSRFYTNTDLIEVTVLKKMVRAKIQGHIGSPGWYSLPIGSDIQDLIKAANGMLDGAVIDRLLIKKHNKPSTQTYSLKVFLENGQDSALHRLEQGDIIFVPMSPIMGTVQRSLMSYTPPPDETRDNIINVLGEVYAPGSYEVNTDVTVLDMIAMAGGPKEPGNPNKVMDLENIRVIRTINGTADVFRFNMNSYFQTGDARLLIQIEAGDNILIPSKKADVEDETKSVIILGMVEKPNSYEISNDINLLGLIANAGGFKKEQSHSIARTDSVTLIIHDSLGIPFEYTVNIDQYLKRPDIFPLPKLHANDIVIVHPTTNSELLIRKEAGFINIIGEVHTPGRYPVRIGESILDAVARAGGPTLATADYHIRLIRIYNGKKLQTEFDMEYFYSDEPGITEADCTSRAKCTQEIPTVQSGDHIIIDRKDEIEISWWLDFIWKTATVGLFLFATWGEVGR